jgi:hypothetical protein
MLTKRLFVAAVMLGFLVQGVCYAATPGVALSYPAMAPVPPPSPGHTVKVNNLLIIADVSRSMNDAGKEGTEKAFLISFNNGIPKGLKNAGMRTFGKSAYYHTVLVQPVQRYDRSIMGSLIGDLKAGCGNTPLASALTKAQTDLEETTGNIAILVVSDGENLTRDPIRPTIALKETYGGRLCIHTVHVGDSEKGRMILEKVARYSECGTAKTAGELQSTGAMKEFIADIFYEHAFIDSDGDGVPDWADKCPNTPKGVKVDKNGCPLDSDGDGVPDYLDRCPNTPRGVKVDKNGCPLDSDGDGVPDYLDKCPNTPRGVKVDKNGCPLDSDGDGVPDYLDKCPNTPRGVEVDAAGCWIAKGLKFDFNKWDIKPEYYPSLDRAVRVLEMNPKLRVEIHGHTDSIGSQAYNLTLSEKRAQAVKDYLVSRGISTGRLTTRGMGKLDPVASNDTPEGRAQNRRVEFNIISY